MRAVPTPPVDTLDLEQLEAGIPNVADVPTEDTAATLAQIGSLQARLSALASALVARTLALGAVTRLAASEPDKLLSVAEAARLLGVGKDYVYEHQRELPMVRQGRRLLFSASGLQRVIRERRNKRGLTF